MQLEDVRRQFPVVGQGVAYLDHASKSPFSDVVQQAALWFIEQRQGKDVIFFPSILEQKEKYRRHLGRWLGAEHTDRIAWSLNTTDSMNLLIDQIDWKEGDEVIVFCKDFPANVFPFLALQKRYGVTVKQVKDDHFFFREEDYLTLISPRTKLLSVSAVGFLTGQVAQLALLGEQCRKHGVLFCVDAAQAAGAIPLQVDEWGIDFLACSGHKWSMFQQGCGYFYFSENLLGHLNGYRSGWLEKEEPFDLFNQEKKVSGDQERFTYGTGNDMSIVIANAVMDFRAQFGEERIYQRVSESALFLKKELKKMGASLLSREEDMAGIVTFSCRKSSEVCEKLLEKKVVVRDRGENLLRVSPHYYNDSQDLEKFLREIKPFV